MQSYSSTEGSPLESPESLILACWEKVRKMASGIAAHDLRLDAEDLSSIGMLEICEMAPRALTVDDPMGYLYRTARYAMLHK